MTVTATHASGTEPLNNLSPTALLLNVGHALDHLFLLIFATAVAAIARDFGLASWEDLMPYTVGAFTAFGLCSLPAGRLGDLWGRRPMMIVFFIGLFIVAMVLSLAIALIGALTGSSNPGALTGGLLGGLIQLAIFVIELYLMVRCMMTLPIIVLEHERNPLKALRRSWRMTGNCAWKVLGFVVLLGIAYFVIVLLLTLLVGAIGLVGGGASEIGAGSAFGFAVVASVMGSLVAILASGILVSMHRQLAGGAEPRDLKFDA